MRIKFVVSVEVEDHATDNNPDGKRFSVASLTREITDSEGKTEVTALGVQPTMSKGAAGAMSKGYAQEIGRQLTKLVGETYPHNKRKTKEAKKTVSRTVRK